MTLHTISSAEFINALKEITLI